MSRVAYVDGRYVPHKLAVVHIEDRGYQFADGVYEVLAVVKGHLIDLLPVGSGMPGPLSRKLRDCYLAHAAAA